VPSGAGSACVSGGAVHAVGPLLSVSQIRGMVRVGRDLRDHLVGVTGGRVVRGLCKSSCDLVRRKSGLDLNLENRFSPKSCMLQSRGRVGIV